MTATAAPPPERAAPRGRDGSGDAIRVEGATKLFDGVAAVRDVTLNVPTGTILGMIGPSGAGKTTTVRLLTGALRPTRGVIRVLGEDPMEFRRRTRERIGYMPQLFTLYPDLTASENVDFVASLFGMLWLRRRRRVREVLQVVDLWDARKRRASALSGGMQRRLELACALVHEPTLLFLDEPTAGIDPLLRVRIWTELHRLKSEGRTLVVTTQYLNEAEECDSVALIAQGGLVAWAPPDDVRRQATGGDVIELETAGTFDAAVLADVPQVRGIRQQGPRSFRVTVEDAGTATPEIVAAVTTAGAEVLWAREYRPSFDEVFAELVGRARGETDGNDQIDGGVRTEPETTVAGARSVAGGRSVEPTTADAVTGTTPPATDDGTADTDTRTADR
ncbi:MAG TPA: ABC transporter ATP-binding protein [Candidatus Limnocylindrales bacterium]